jgi:hypothetical protein
MERKFIIEAAIVRTMKARQTLHHNDLISEVMRLVRFPLDIAVLKQRIESLIESEYMKHDDKDKNTYNYIA